MPHFNTVILRSERDERSLFFLSAPLHRHFDRSRKVEMTVWSKEEKSISAKTQRFFIPLRFIQNDKMGFLAENFLKKIRRGGITGTAEIFCFS